MTATRCDRQWGACLPPWAPRSDHVELSLAQERRPSPAAGAGSCWAGPALGLRQEPLPAPAPPPCWFQRFNR